MLTRQQHALLPGAVSAGAQAWAGRITSAVQKSAEAIFEVGRLLIEAKAALPHGEFEAMVENSLPFKASSAQRLMIVARDGRLANPAHVQLLPASWGTLYELTKLDDQQFAAGIERGVIRADMERKHVKQLTVSGYVAPAREADQTGTAEDLAAIAERGVKFGNIYADPPWLYGNQATRASTDNHYVGMSVDDICALPVADLAAETAHLHLWTTNGFLPEAFRVIEAWGFTYKSCLVWIKPQMGIGNYWRVSHEFLLLGTRGQCVFTEHNHMSWLQAERGRHSAKPAEIRHIIERVSPSPRLELFGRAAQPGWIVWGNEVSRDLLTRDVEALVAA